MGVRGREVFFARLKIVQFFYDSEIDITVIHRILAIDLT